MSSPASAPVQSSSMVGDDQKQTTKRPSILSLAGPSALGNLLMSLVGVINIKMVSQLGTTAIAAVSTGHRVFFIFQALLMAVNAGTTALVARHWGAQEYDQASEILKISLIINAALAIVSSILMFVFASSIVGIFGLDPETTQLASEYISVYGLFTLGFAFHLSFGAALRASGDSLTPLYLGAVANAVTVSLSYILIFGKFGAPQLGIVGSALGAAGFLAASILFFILWQTNRLRIKPSTKAKISKAQVRQLLQIGYPAGIEQFIIQVGFLSFLWVVAFYGTEAFAAYGIGVSILAFSFVIGIGFSIAGATLVGQHLGAGDIALAKAAGWKSMRFSLVTMSILAVIIIIFARPLAQFMVNDPVVVEHTVVFIYILGAVQPLMAIDFAIGGALRGAGDTKFPLMTSLACLVLVRVSLAMFFLWLKLDIAWIYGALIFDYILKAILLSYRFHSEKWAHAVK